MTTKDKQFLRDIGAAEPVSVKPFDQKAAQSMIELCRLETDRYRLESIKSKQREIEMRTAMEAMRAHYSRREHYMYLAIFALSLVSAWGIAR